MTNMPMSDEDRQELVRLARESEKADAAAAKARAARNRFMHAVYNGWSGDIHEIARAVGLRRQQVHLICRGPRTGSRRPLSSARWRRGGETT